MRVGWEPAWGLYFLVIGVFAGAWPGSAQSVDELVQRALSSNREYLAGLERVRQAEALLRQAGVRPMPALDAEGGSTRLLGSAGSQQYSLAYSHPLETAGKRPKRMAVATLGMEIARAEADERRRLLIREVRQDYAEAVSAARKAALLSDFMRIDAETLRLVTARVENGDAAPLERHLLETEIARNEAESALAEGKVQIGLLELEKLGALAPGTRLLNAGPVKASAAPAGAELTKRALDGRPDLRVLALSEAQARAEIELTRADSSPNVTAAARFAMQDTLLNQLGYDSSGNLGRIRDRDGMLSFGVSVPLFSARKNLGNIDAAVAREREARLRREHLAATIPTEVNLALRQWEAAGKALEIYNARIVPQAERNVDVIRQTWQLGESRFLDVLNEQRKLAELRLAQVDAEAGVMKAWAELEHAVGGDLR